MDPSKAAKNIKDAVENTAEKVVEKAADMMTPDIPGRPGAEPPAMQEPTEPREPLPPKPDQGAPEVRSATGKDTGEDPRVRAQQGALRQEAS